MFTSSAKVLVQIITGGRPDIRERTTAKLLPYLKEAGLTDIEWVIRSDHVDGYETDEHPFNVYSVEWATEFARTHWRHPIARWEPGGFFGAFPGREWAMRSGEQRGYDLVLQLDDNVVFIGVVSATARWGTSSREFKFSPGEILSVQAELAMSTNGYMVGMNLSALPPNGMAKKVIRPGFPYSVFFEKTGSGRMPYYGPFEDDVMHAMEYGLHGGPHRTATSTELFVYAKDHSSTSGMRKHYNPTRGLELAKRYPKNAIVTESKRTVSPRETERGMRHFLNTKGFTPVRVHDRERFAAAQNRAVEMVAEAREMFYETSREAMRARALSRSEDLA